MPRPRNATDSEIPKQPIVVLRVWEYDFGVPSVDPDSLIIMTLLKLYEIENYTTYASFPLCGNIPSLQHNDVILSKGPELLPYVVNEICHEDRIIPPVKLTIINNYKKYFMECFAQTFIFDWALCLQYKLKPDLKGIDYVHDTCYKILKGLELDKYRKTFEQRSQKYLYPFSHFPVDINKSININV